MSDIDNTEKVVAGALLAPAFTALILLFILIEGFVLWCLWAWFIVPFGVREITLLHAMGLVTVGAIFQNVTHCESNTSLRMRLATNALIRPAVILVCGYVIKQSMG